MPNLTPFNNPFLVGFDELEQLLLRATKGADSFPPYNLEQIDETTFEITMAVAGYAEADLDIAQEDNQLVIRGHQEHDSSLPADDYDWIFILCSHCHSLGCQPTNGPELT